jgi:TonB family protein
MMTNRAARNRAGWIAALAGALVLTPALLLALPAPRPVGVAGVRALFGAKAEPEYAARVTPTLAVAVPSVDTVPVSSGRPSNRVRGFQELIPPRDTVPDSTRFSYEVARLDRQPTLINLEEIKETIERFYPSTLRSAGVAGTAMVQFVVQPDGRVDLTTIKSISASDPLFATASILVAERFLFRPGERNGKPVRVMIQMPISWQPPSTRSAAPAAGAADRPDVDVAAPANTGVLRGEVWRSPSIAEVQKLIRDSYPQLLASAPPENTTLSVVAMNDGSIVSSHLAASGRLAVDAAGLAAPEIAHMMVVKAAAGKVPVDVIWMIRK